ncbi:MAG TPA: AsmA-like C-terminal region-containing protein, partial [Pirellulales bacterium]|nr:AsmA-like C-terminal region-containing protein [Pirellulales bacterium]
KDLQFTQVQGPLRMDETQVLLGAAAEPAKPGELPHHVTAHFYGGQVEADCAFALGDPARFSLQGLLSDGDLKKFAHETIPGKQKLDGRVRASISLDGDTSGIHSLTGRGDVQLVKADIYELPFMVALLKLLNFKPPDATAFSNSTATYRIQADHIYLDKLALNGDAISLEGSGEMNLDGAIDLRFHSLPGRADWELPVFKTVMGAASRQVAMIRVQGTLSDPQMKRDVLPGVGKALQTMQDNMQPQPLYPQARGQQPQLER